MNRRDRRRAAKQTRRGLDGAVDGAQLHRTLAAATQYHQAGRLADAQRLYRQVLAAQPDNADALHLLGVLANQAGAHDDAADLIRRAIAIDPREPSYHYNLGEALRAAGHFADAAASYRQVLALDPQVADAHFNLANALYEMGDVREAAAGYRRAIALAPEDAEAHNNLGNALMALEDFAGAAERYRAALERRPDYAEALANLGGALGRLGDNAAAIAVLERAVALTPALAEAHLNLGLAHRDAGNIATAIACVERAAALDPALIAAHEALGRLFQKRQRWAEAEACFRRALEARPEDVALLNRLGDTLLEQTKTAQAAETFERALALDPDDATTIANLGTCRQEQGRFDEAADHLRRALALDPNMTGALLNLVAMRRVSSPEEITRAEALAEAGALDDEQQTRLHFALARYCDDRGAWDEAFDHFRAANAMRERTSGFDVARWVGYVDGIIAAHPKGFFAARRDFGLASEKPVFVLGMPRSGTTLVEQIIASHGEAFGAGELFALRDIAAALHERVGSAAPYPACVDALDRETAAAIAADYLAGLDALSDARRVVDKMPVNFLRLGLIAVLFPGARIIHCRRDPLDTCLSCYFQDFRGLDFSSDLAKTGAFHRQYERLMAHWQAVLPLTILDVQYEALIANQEAESRRIIAHLGLDWDPRCLSFHETDRVVRTASIWQARQPIYASAIGRWRHYERHLGPLKKALGLADA